jgi:hypothetical protein
MIAQLGHSDGCIFHRSTTQKSDVDVTHAHILNIISGYTDNIDVRLPQKKCLWVWLSEQRRGRGDTFNSSKWSKKGVLMPCYQGLFTAFEKVCWLLGRTMPILLR